MCFGVVISLICRRSFSGQQARERAPELWGLEGGESYPAPERHIIDTSERTWANNRYVMGKHFGVLADTSEPDELANIS